ncbi:MAG: hypothetical protein ABEK75_10700 [Salinibacter sp.]
MIWRPKRDQWLIDALTTSDAPFELVVNGGQVTTQQAKYETLARYPQEQSLLFEMLQTREMEGVVFLSGNRHVTELLHRKPEGFFPIDASISSPLTAGSATDFRNESGVSRFFHRLSWEPEAGFQ